MIVLYHHAGRANKGLKNPLVDPRMFSYYPAYDLGISRKLLSKEFPRNSQRSWYRDRGHFFHLYFYAKVGRCILREKKGTNY